MMTETSPGSGRWGSGTTPGTWKITVTATTGGKTKTINIPFVVN
jgi:hypothetical protein